MPTEHYDMINSVLYLLKLQTENCRHLSFLKYLDVYNYKYMSLQAYVGCFALLIAEANLNCPRGSSGIYHQLLNGMRGADLIGHY